MTRLSVRPPAVTDARNEETMQGFMRRIEATPPGQCAITLLLSLGSRVDFGATRI